MDDDSRERSREDIRRAMARLVRAAREKTPRIDAPPPQRVPPGPAPPVSKPSSRPLAKVPISIRLDADLVETLRATGRGWQSRANASLRATMGLGSAAPEQLAGDPEQDHGADHGDHQRTDE